MSERQKWFGAAFAVGLIPAVLINLGIWLLFPFPFFSTFAWFSINFFPEDWLPLRISGTLFMLCFGSIIFFLLGPRLARGRPEVPSTAIWLLPLLTLINAACLVAGRSDGGKYYGEVNTNAVILVSLVWMYVIWRLFAAARTRKTFRAALLYHFLFVLWLLTYAFPSLGVWDI
ncbi:MAG: hypothetical protein HY046_06785 [Acidobacteria bacterium]|nr:hypothetical protein [Acidobacteriota bacterium]